MPHLRRSDYVVRDIPKERARALVRRHHYTGGGSKSGVYYHGLFRRTAPRRIRLVGVAWWLPPTMAAARSIYPSDPPSVLALTRLVVQPGEPTNAASFILGASIRSIRADGRFKCLLTYADTRLGHTGAIYRATNWVYCGLTKRAHATWIDPRTGQEVSRMRGRKTMRKPEMLAKGYEYVGRFKKHKFIYLLDRREHAQAKAAEDRQGRGQLAAA